MDALLAFFQKFAAFFTSLFTLTASLFGGGSSGPFEPVLETRYASNGSYEAVSLVFPSDDAKIGSYRIWYPEGKKKCPAVIFLNGSGQKTAWFSEYFARFASFGIVSIGTDDTDAGTGYSAEKALEFLLAQNADPDSELFGKVNTKKIGIAGYSQGGAGALRSASLLPISGSFCTVAAISPSNEARAESKGWTYDSSKINVPVLMVSGTEDDDAYGTITSLAQMRETFDKIPGSKAMARKIGVGHQNARQQTVGYITAWMCWQLCGDKKAAKVFTGRSPEIAENPEWQDVNLKLRSNWLFSY